MPAMISRLTSKGQATIPARVRRVDSLDAAFLKLQQEALADWDAPEADAAFRNL